jgi:hypothetical protein
MVKIVNTRGKKFVRMYKNIRYLEKTGTCQNNVCIYGEIKIRLNSGYSWQSGVRNLHKVSNKLNKGKGVFLENVLFPQMVKNFSTL